MNLKTFLITTFLLVSGVASAQKVAIKNNLLYDAFPAMITHDATLTPNLGLEIGLSKKWTLDTQFGTNCFMYERDATSSKYKTKKISHWLLQPELRYWTCEAFNGWFFGLHAHGGQFNWGELDNPFILNRDKDMKDHRYEGYFYGAGLSVGYQWILSNRFSLEASAGGGYARVIYDKFNCTKCGDKLGDGNANYLGPTKATLSIIYFFK